MKKYLAKRKELLKNNYLSLATIALQTEETEDFNDLKDEYHQLFKDEEGALEQWSIMEQTVHKMIDLEAEIVTLKIALDIKTNESFLNGYELLKLLNQDELNFLYKTAHECFSGLYRTWHRKKESELTNPYDKTVNLLCKIARVENGADFFCLLRHNLAQVLECSMEKQDLIDHLSQRLEAEQESLARRASGVLYQERLQKLPLTLRNIAGRIFTRKSAVNLGRGVFVAGGFASYTTLTSIVGGLSHVVGITLPFGFYTGMVSFVSWAINPYVILLGSVLTYLGKSRKRLSTGKLLVTAVLMQMNESVQVRQQLNNLRNELLNSKIDKEVKLLSVDESIARYRKMTPWRKKTRRRRAIADVKASINLKKKIEIIDQKMRDLEKLKYALIAYNIRLYK